MRAGARDFLAKAISRRSSRALAVMKDASTVRRRRCRRERFTLMHDAPVAHAGALAGMPGVVVIAGTGSVVYARDENGRSQTLGGWGFLFGDEGSAFRHCSRCARTRDGRRGRRRSLAPRRSARGLRFLCNGLASPPCTRILRRRTHPRAARRLYAGRNSIRRASAKIAEEGADRLAALAHRVLAATKEPRAALTGGLFADAGFYERVRGGILAAVPSAQVGRAKYEPAAGALLLAYRELGLSVPELAAMKLLEALRGGLIVSVQAWRGSALDDPHVIAAMAASRARWRGRCRPHRGRRESARRTSARRPADRRVGQTRVSRIRALHFADACGGGIDHRRRRRDRGLRCNLLGRGRTAACSSTRSGPSTQPAGWQWRTAPPQKTRSAASAAGADILATTLCGYTAPTKNHALPALDLVAELSRLGKFGVCEGGVRMPADVRAALDAGADAVVVGTAITNVDWLVREFAGAADRGS